MYIPKHFIVDDPQWIRTFMESNAFGTLVTTLRGELFATHLPFLYDPEPAPLGTLRAHLARANPHWQSFGDSPQLAIFTGPHAYVSPTWYKADGPAVPTWNYTAVHAYGRAEIIDDPEGVRELLRQLTDREEAGRSPRYSVEDLSEEYLEHMARQIVAFEIPLVRIEAKAKLSQNRTPEERSRVADTLGGQLKEMMEELSLA
ncbi:MAG TPA: FMN-binding negative transcriptional regulator [Candidatus Acidoferrales bacterium]|nr:FMN-binding negative transcriptional regulator [Candidatus Acidoferrales bacterium]